MTTLMIGHDHSVSVNIPSVFVYVHSVSLHILSVSMNLHTVFIPKQTEIMYVHSIPAKTFYVTMQNKFKHTDTSLIHACRFKVSLHDYIRMVTTVNPCKEV